MNQLRFIKQNIYTLKRQYGYELDLYSITDIAIDLETGVKDIETVVYNIKKAILLPRKMYGEEIANRNLVDKETRLIILDVKDYPKDYVVKQKDYIIIRHERFNILDCNLFDHKLALVMTVVKIVGQEPVATIQQALTDNLTISQEIRNE